MSDESAEIEEQTTHQKEREAIETHRYAMVASLERARLLEAIAAHRVAMTVGLERLHDRMHAVWLGIMLTMAGSTLAIGIAIVLSRPL